MRIYSETYQGEKLGDETDNAQAVEASCGIWLHVYVVCQKGCKFPSTIRKQEHAEEETCLYNKDERTRWAWGRGMWSWLLQRAAREYPARWRWGSKSSITCGFAPFQNICYTASESARVKSSKDDESLLAQHLDALPPPPINAICFFGTLQCHNLRIILQWLTKN